MPSCTGGQISALAPLTETVRRSVQPKLQPVIRPYCSDRDHADVVHVCRNVYGGTDDLPTTINAAASQPHTHILTVAASSGAPLDALLCCQQRGDVLWLWGARTREEARGRGLARLLLEEAELLARRLPGVQALQSVTVPANATMWGVFSRCGFTPQHDPIVSWPASDTSLAAHQQLQQQHEESLAGHEQRSLLSVLPQVAAVATSSAAHQLLPHWRPCRSAQELNGALLQLRQPRTGMQLARLAEEQQQQQQQQPGKGPLAADSFAFNWLPGEYELIPAGWPVVQQLAGQGSVLVLDPGAAASSGQPWPEQAEEERHAAVLVLWGPSSRGVRYAGIVAGSPAALESSLLHAAVADPRCCKFYVDCCGRFQHQQLWECTPGERFDIVPFCKLL
ncbi:hypothetical protein D9Q98_006074 [Chlorella vulgaris]|uniref:N-acetyltransferase domain-containing protein n=1 Tax=Chlorella vulgaris TaxID=3077 RepID=A0A9D4TWV9_CHLVU|nr:hypothetical protein D9Q98_006074 [Chlorella vulgaris]